MNSGIESAGAFKFKEVVRLDYFFEHVELLSLDFWLFVPDSVEEVTAATPCLPAPSDDDDWAWAGGSGWKEYLSSHDVADVIGGLREQEETRSEDALIAALNYFWKNDAYIGMMSRDGGRE